MHACMHAFLHQTLKKASVSNLFVESKDVRLWMLLVLVLSPRAHDLTNMALRRISLLRSEAMIVDANVETTSGVGTCIGHGNDNDDDDDNDNDNDNGNGIVDSSSSSKSTSAISASSRRPIMWASIRGYSVNS